MKDVWQQIRLGGHPGYEGQCTFVLNAISSDFLAKQLKTRAEFFALGLKDPLLWVIDRQWSQALCTEASLPTVVTLP